MADTARNIAALKSILADNNSGSISPQDLRDFLVSALNIVETSLQTIQSPLTVTGAVTATSFTGSGANLTALPAGELTGSVADARLSANVPLKNTANTFSQNQTVTGTLAATTLTGAGSGITALSGTNISTGTVADARLSSNVPLKNGTNTYTAPQTFTGGLVSNQFSGDGGSLTNLNASSLNGGVVNDSRLSSNIPKKNVDNTFTGSITATAVYAPTISASSNLSGNTCNIMGALACNSLDVGLGAITIDASTVFLGNNGAGVSGTFAATSFSGDGTSITNVLHNGDSVSLLYNDAGYITSGSISIPTNVSAFTNDVPYVTSTDLAGLVQTGSSATLSSLTIGDNVSQLQSDGSLVLGNNLTVTNGVSVGGLSTFADGVTVNADTVINGSLGVSGITIDADGISFPTDSVVISTSDASITTTGSVSAGIGSFTSISASTVIFSSLPTSDPFNAGQLWNDSGTLKVS